jgi:flagellar biosynthesis protein FlhG
VTSQTLSAPGLSNSAPAASPYYPAPARQGEDQASRLRAMMDALSGTTVVRHPPSAPAVEQRPSPRPAPAPPVSQAQAAPTRRCPVVAITSGKGGVGKTSTCVNLAIALAESRFRAALLDADLGLANADVLCGLTPTTRLDAVVEFNPGAAAPRRQLSQIAIEAPGGFRLVPGSVGIRRMANLPPAQRQAIFAGLSEIESQSDIVLVDTGAGLSDGVTSFAAAADLTLVVATPEPTSIADAYAMIKTIAQLRATIAPKAGFRTALIVNQAASPEEGRAVHARIGATCKKFLGIEPPLLGIVSHDPALPASVRSRRPVMLGDPSSRCCKDLRLLAANLTKLLDLKAPPEPPKEKRKLFGIFSRG